MNNKVTEDDVKALQKIQKKMLGHELPKDITRDSLENTPITELMKEYYETFLTYHEEIKREKMRDKVGVDFVKGAFIGFFVGLVISWTEGGREFLQFSIVGGLIGGLVGAFAPPFLEIINNYAEKNDI